MTHPAHLDTVTLGLVSRPGGRTRPGLAVVEAVLGAVATGMSAMHYMAPLSRPAPPSADGCVQQARPWLGLVARIDPGLRKDPGLRALPATAREPPDTGTLLITTARHRDPW